jgi:PAS domain S-box-containing protein
LTVSLVTFTSADQTGPTGYLKHPEVILGRRWSVILISSWLSLFREELSMPKVATEIRLLLASIVESSNDAIISKDLNGIITTWNAAAEQIFGYSAAEATGRPISILAPPDRVDEMPTILAQIREGQRVDHFETVRRRKDGQLISVSLTVSPIRDAEGGIIGASKILRDITERNLAVQALAEQAEQLARSNADLHQFAYVTSHDLQEPLRTVSGLSELVKRRYSGRQLDEDGSAMLDLVVSAAERMKALIRDLLSYSTTLHSTEIPLTRVDMKSVVRWALNNLHQSIEETGAFIEVGPLPDVHGNKLTLVQLFQNLISNAIKYRGADPPRIEISATPAENDWVFSVADNGIGIAPAYHQKVFGLFTRLHGDRYPGTGIGLALCKNIVEKHDGFIRVESELNKGATFKFSLPKEVA